MQKNTHIKSYRRPAATGGGGVFPLFYLLDPRQDPLFQVTDPKVWIQIKIISDVNPALEQHNHNHQVFFSSKLHNELIPFSG